MKKIPKLVKVLRDINALRHKLGKGPINRIPKGYQEEVKSCPLAKATGLQIPDDGWARVDYWDTNATSYKLTATLNKFITKFDNGDYPHLVK